MLALHIKGYVHKEENKQKQDIASVFKTEDNKTVSIICDGCSSLAFPEVGATLFCVLFKQKFKNSTQNVDKVVRDTLLTILNTMAENDPKNYDDTIFKFLGFTIVICVEYENEFKVYSSGDGTILAITKDNIIEYSVLEDVPNVPKYLAYDYIQDKTKLSEYKDGVQLVENNFIKAKYKQIGVASDGLQYMLTSVKVPLRVSFEKILLDEKISDIQKYNALVKLFYDNHSDFGDDVSLAIN